MRIASLAWTLRPCRGLVDWLAHLQELVKPLSGKADLVVLPELICLELLWGNTEADACQISEAASDHWIEQCRSLAQETEVTLVGGSMIVRTDQGHVNRAVVADPTGKIWFQDKLVMTQFEQDDWSLQSGHEQTVRNGLGVAVCYDSEFSRVFEPLSDQGALVVAVPSFTETAHGHHRVHTCAAARATEFQIVVAVAPLLGSLGAEPVPTTYGYPAIYAPCVPPFPADGVLAKGETVAIAEVDLDVLIASRESGDVRNFHDQARLRGLS